MMRIFYFNKDNPHDPLTLLSPRPLHFPPEIIQRIVDYVPRTNLPAIASVNRVWHATVMPVLYRHLYIRTWPHWLLLVRTFSQPSFSSHYGPCVNSLVLQPSPRLVSSQLTSALNQRVIENDDALQPSLRGYVRLERVDYQKTGLETIETPMLDNEEHENYSEIDTTHKESEWLASVTDDQVCCVLRHASQLEYLQLSGCENVGDSIMSTLAVTKSMPQSKSMVGLWLSLLRNMTPWGLLQLIQAEKQYGLPKRLKHLDLGFQVLMTDEAIHQIASYWGSSLTHIRLNSIYQLTDHAILSLAEHCPHLQLLHLVRCWPVTNAALHTLAQHGKQLKYVSVSFLSRSNEEGIKHLIHQCPELVWLDITGCGINSIFKSIIIEGWRDYRRQHHLPPVYIKDGAINLL